MSAEVTGQVRTLGDIADVLQAMKDQGITRESIVYALDRVYWEVTT